MTDPVNYQHAALHYAKAGLRVLPLAPGTKQPAISDWTNQSTSNPDTVDAWWAEIPRANIGVATGPQPAGFGLLVIDVDNKNGKDGKAKLAELEKLYSALPRTVRADTPGGGQHYLLRYPVDANIRGGANRLGRGIDVLAEGQQVVVAPSRTEVGRYRFHDHFSTESIAIAPDWLVELLAEDQAAPASRQIETDSPSNRSEIDEDEIRHLLSFIESRPHYDNWIRVIAAVLDLCDGDKDLAEELLIDWSPEEEPGEYRKKLNNPLSRVKGGTLFHLAKENGYKREDDTAEVLKCLDLDERGDARLFARTVRHRVLYDFDNKCFLRYSNGVWVEDRAEASLREMPALIGRKYLSVSSELDKRIQSRISDGSSSRSKVLENQRDQLRERSRRLNKRSRVNNVTEFVRRELACESSKFDQQAHLLNLANGTFDLEAKTLLPHDPADRLSKQSAARYQPGAAAPHWLEFLGTIFEGDVELIEFCQDMVGYLLSGWTDEDVIFFLYGTGANGKSTFVSVLKLLLGDYFCTVPVNTFISKGYSSSDEYHLATLKGARCCVASEVPQGKRLDESLVKHLTGGDLISARRPYGQPFSFSPTHKLIMVGNHKPRISGTDMGIWRRIRLIPFRHAIPDVNQIPRSTLMELFASELSGILNWALEGSERVRREGLSYPNAIRSATSNYRSDSDIIGTFLTDRYEFVASEKVAGPDLFKTYQKWCDETGEKCLSQRALYSVLRERDMRLERGASNRMFIHGIRYRG